MSEGRGEWAGSYHGHERRPHLVDPDVVAVGPEAVHDDLGGAGGVEGAVRPAPGGSQVAEGHVQQRDITPEHASSK